MGARNVLLAMIANQALSISCKYLVHLAITVLMRLLMLTLVRPELTENNSSLVV